LANVFHNYAELIPHHRRFVSRLHKIQQEEHPIISSIAADLFDLIVNLREPFLKYVPNVPIANYKIQEEQENNSNFRTFHDVCAHFLLCVLSRIVDALQQTIRHPDAHRLDMKAFVLRPVPRINRYQLLLRTMLRATPPDHEDQDTIPRLLEAIRALERDTEPGVEDAKQKVQLWEYSSKLIFKPGEEVDLDLFNERRKLLCSGRLFIQANTSFVWSGWSELFCFLFDNYCK
jgi:RHO1 GDP-GTP exchange protein 1/2